MSELTFSTILTKGAGVTKPKNTTEQFIKISQVFEKKQSAPQAGKASMNLSAVGDRLLKSDRFIYIDKQEQIPVLICKKAKKSNKSMIRTGFISRSDVFKFVQDKKKKAYGTPFDFVVENKEEFDKAYAAAPKGLLAWDTKEIVGKPYRIRFRRHANLPEGQSDTAFYFDNLEDCKKMRNFLKGIQLLETEQAKGKGSFSAHLEALYKSFQIQMTVKFRQLLRSIATERRGSAKDNIIKQSSLLNQLNKRAILIAVRRWQDYVDERQDSKRRHDQDDQDREVKLICALTDSKDLSNLNQKVINLMLDAWKSQALAQAQPNKEDINILFNYLEIAQAVENPTVRVEVKLANTVPDTIKLNGKTIPGRAREFRIQTDLKPSTKQQNNQWRLIGAPGDLSEEQKRFVRDTYVPASVNLTGDKFSLHFEEFPLEHLKNVEITVNVFDKRNVRKAYYNTSLRVLRIAGKRGKNAWLCLSTPPEMTGNFPLIHLRVETRNAKSRQNRLSAPGQDKKLRRFENTSYIDDTFYDYRFKLPVISPDQKEFLELMPASWDLLDPKSKELANSQAQSDFMQRIKYKLLKHYHEATTKQLALLKKSSLIWAEVQNDILTYLPNSSLEDESQLYVNEFVLKEMIKKPGEERGTAKVSGYVVSLLFKRDLWESNDQWRRFYKELEYLCQRGVPPQSRIDIWSELGRTIYFIKLTDMDYLHNTQNGDLRTAATVQEDDVNAQSESVYNALKEATHKQFSHLYQDLEDDLVVLRETFVTSKLPFEKHIRNICRVFISWSKIFANSSDPQRKYNITYSRSIATLCYGLLTCQNCTFFENPDDVQEHKVFWLLISLVTYVASSYFEANERSVEVDTLTFKGDDVSRRRNTLANSVTRCQHVKGIKSDLLLLKILLQDYEPEIYNKLEEFGIPLEHYFGDHMLNLFFTLFNPGLTFRIWDLLFLEGSSMNQVRSHRIMICIIFTFLRECKAQLLKARHSDDVKFIIEMNARFITDYGVFIHKSYDVCAEYFEQKLPASDTIVEKLSYIKYAFFNSDYNKFDKKIKEVEKVLENHYQPTFAQNQEIYNLIKQKFHYKGPEKDAEVLSYPILSHMIKTFASNFGNVLPSQDQENQRKLLGEKVTTVWAKVFRVSSYGETLADTSVRLIYGSQNVSSTKEYNPTSVGLEGRFDVENATLLRELVIEVWNERDPMRAKKVKNVVIDLKGVPVNVVTKLNLLLNEQEHDIYNEDYAISEVEVAVLLEAPQTQEEIRLAKKQDAEPLLIPQLEDSNYKDYKGMKIHQSIRSEITKQQQISDSILSHFSVGRRSHFAWKSNFAMDTNQFIQAARIFAPFWDQSSLKNIYKAVTKASRNNAFYIADFFVLLILNAKATTLSQKFSLLYELFGYFNTNFSSSPGEISLDALKGLAKDIYDIFMIHIPQNQLDNMIELACTGNTTCVRQVFINEQIQDRRIDFPKHVLNKLANYVHLYHNSKDIHVESTVILNLLRDVYVKEIKTPLLEKNTVDIIYYTQGRNHRMTINVDKNWKLLDEQPVVNAELNQETKRLLGVYNHVLTLNNPPVVYNKNQFVRVMQRLPLLNYLFSFENLEQSNILIQLRNIRFRINHGGETLYSIDLSAETSHRANIDVQKRAKFNDLLINWPSITRQAHSKVGQSQSRTYRVDQTLESSRILPQKLDICLSYSKLLSNIKKALIKNISEGLTQSWNNVGEFHPKLYNENLYNLDFDVGVTINRSIRYERLNPEDSPLLSLTDAIENLIASQDSVNDLEIVYNLKDTIVRDPYVEPYSHLALYRYTDGATEWLPCKISYKFSFGNAASHINLSQVDGYGVVFEKYPNANVLKKVSEVIIREELDLNELELKRVDRKTFRATTIDQGYMNKSASDMQFSQGPMDVGKSNY